MRVRRHPDAEGGPMTQVIAPPTRRLLAAGIVAAPLLLGLFLVQALTRDGFDPTYHPLSLLSLGDAGWIQIATFVGTGLLYLTARRACERPWIRAGDVPGCRA